MIAGAIGPGFGLGGKVGASGAILMLEGEGEYTFTKSLSAVGDLSLGLAGTKPVRLAGGARYRLAGLDLPVSPFAQAELTFGRLYGVLNANLNYWGLRLGGGADYMVTAKISAGGLLAYTLARTFGDRPSYYGTLDVLAYGRYTF